MCKIVCCFKFWKVWFCLLTVVLVIFRVVSPAEARAETEVCQLDVAVFIDQDVVRLYIPVNETHLVNTVYRQNQLADVKPIKEKKNLISDNQEL